LQSVANFRAHVLSRTSISPNPRQQFRWIRGQWQLQFPSPRDRVPPFTATPRLRRQSLPSRLTKDSDAALTSRHRAILLRSSIPQRLPRMRPTGTAVRFDDVTKRSQSSTAQQPRGVSDPAYKQQVHPQQIESTAYHYGDSAYQPPGHAHQPPGVVSQRPVDVHPYYPGDTGQTAAVKERTYSERTKEEDEGWSSSAGMEYAPTWSRTMAAPMSRSEATLSFTQKPQTRGPSAPTTQPQMLPPDKSDDWTVGGTSSASPRPTTSLQPLVRSTEPAGAGPMGGAMAASPRPPAGGQATQRPAELVGAGLAQRRDVLRQKKLAVIEKSDSVDEDEFDKLVAINYKQLVDGPPTPTGTTTLSPPITGDPRRSPKLSPRLTRRPSPTEQAPPISALPPALGAPPSRLATSGNRQELKTEEESEDELSK